MTEYTNERNPLIELVRAMARRRARLDADDAMRKYIESKKKSDGPQSSDAMFDVQRSEAGLGLGTGK
jgi:hypothetical protein